MTKQTALWIAGVGTISLIAAATLVAVFASGSNAGFKDAAAAVAFITAAAIAIERVLEAMWTFVGGMLGTYWPLSAITKQVTTLVSELDNTLKPFHEQAEAALDRLAAGNKLTQQQIQAAKEEIGRLKNRFDELGRLSPDNQRVQLLAAAAAQNVSFLREKYRDLLPDLDLDQAARIANVAINGLQDFLATFKDNAGRRLISLYFGAILGLGVAGLFGLDLFQAVLETPPDQGPWRWRIVLTGIIIGLGASPTHEVVRAVQEYKKGRKGQNLSKPDLPPRNERKSSERSPKTGDIAT